MSTALKITQIGNSLGVILPKEMLAHLKVGKGDSLFVTEVPDGVALRPYDEQCEQQMALGQKVRALLTSRGMPSVAAEGFQAPGVVVSYTTDPDIQSGKAFIAQGDGETDFMLCEIGGTVGDIEGLPFFEAIRQFSQDRPRGPCIFMHLTLLPWIAASGELKTKPTQHSVKELRAIGIAPDILAERASKKGIVLPAGPAGANEIGLQVNATILRRSPQALAQTFFELLQG